MQAEQEGGKKDGVPDSNQMFTKPVSLALYEISEFLITLHFGEARQKFLNNSI